MGWIATLATGAAALALLLLAALLHARRRLSGVGLLPWDYVMIFCAIVLMAVATHGYHLWQEGWPWPWHSGDAALP